MVSHGGCFSRQKEMPFLIQTTMAERRKALRTSMVKVAAFAAAFATKICRKTLNNYMGLFAKWGDLSQCYMLIFMGKLMNHGMEWGSRNIPWMVAKSCTS